MTPAPLLVTSASLGFPPPSSPSVSILLFLTPRAALLLLSCTASISHCLGLRVDSLSAHSHNFLGGCMSPGSTLLLARDLLRGLLELHSLGVVMTDLKPENVLLDEVGTPLLCDFGLARVVSSSLGQYGGPHVPSPVGSIPYM